MKAILMEHGTPSLITTPGRMNARAGGKVLVDLLAEEDFADLCTITLDWVGDGFTPAMVVNTMKWYPQYDGKRLEHQLILDIEEIFGLDQADHSMLRTIVDLLKQEFQRDRPPPSGLSN